MLVGEAKTSDPKMKPDDEAVTGVLFFVGDAS